MLKLKRRQHGQALITIVIFTIVFFAFVGLAIDSGMLYLERRQLQNAVDAACLAASSELSLGGTESSAVTKGQDFFATNLNNEARVAYNLSFPVTGSTILPNTSAAPQQQNLTNGIEVVGNDVRVAATVPAYTYFMNVVNISTYNVHARARCGPSQGGGLWPIAVNRFPGYNQQGRRIGVVDTALSLPQAYATGGKAKYVAVKDVLQQENISGNTGAWINDGKSKTISGTSPWTTCAQTSRNWYHWGSSGYGSPPPPPAGIGSGVPAGRIGPYYSPDCPASESSPGPEFEIAGRGASPNSGGNAFSGPVMLDLRNIATSVTAYNGQSTAQNPNAWKKSIINYILTQYPGPPVPAGEQLAIYSGVNTGNILDALDKRFKGNSTEIVTSLVYDGTVQRKMDFDIFVKCASTASTTCVDADSYIRRPAPARYTYTDPVTGAKEDLPDVFQGGTCKLASADYYIYSNDYPTTPSAYNGLLGGSVKAFEPAKYTVTLKPQRVSGSKKVTLVARFSGANGSGTTAGSPDSFGNIRVRWSYGSTVSAWQSPNTKFEVVNFGSTTQAVTLEVIQTGTGETGRCGPSNTKTALPPRVSGAHTFQVIGEMEGEGKVHSAYGRLGMAETGSSGFNPNDYFLSFDSEPVAVVVQGEESVLELPVSLTDANSEDPLSLASGTANLPTVWYNPSGVMTTPPSSAQLVTCGSGCTDNRVLITVPNSLSAGLHYVDVQTPPTGGSLVAHSNRYLIRVIENNPAVNPSIDSWVVNLCYANFLITTDLDQASTPNSIKGRAVSGCLNPNQVKMGLTGRVLAW